MKTTTSSFTMHVIVPHYASVTKFWMNDVELSSSRRDDRWSSSFLSVRGRSAVNAAGDTNWTNRAMLCRSFSWKRQTRIFLWEQCDLGIVCPVGHAFGESLWVITMKSFLYPSNTLLELTVIFLFIQNSRMETEGKIFVGTSLRLDVIFHTAFSYKLLSTHSSLGSASLINC